MCDVTGYKEVEVYKYVEHKRIDGKQIKTIFVRKLKQGMTNHIALMRECQLSPLQLTNRMDVVSQLQIVAHFVCCQSIRREMYFFF